MGKTTKNLSQDSWLPSFLSIFTCKNRWVNIYLPQANYLTACAGNAICLHDSGHSFSFISGINTFNYTGHTPICNLLAKMLRFATHKCQHCFEHNTNLYFLILHQFVYYFYYTKDLDKFNWRFSKEATLYYHKSLIISFDYFFLIFKNILFFFFLVYHNAVFGTRFCSILLTCFRHVFFRVYKFPSNIFISFLISECNSCYWFQ
jgi:hypothetical protein